METENVKTVCNLKQSAAHQLTTYGVQVAQKCNLDLAIAVVDRSGMLLAFIRMDNAKLITTDVAIGKAKSAVYLKAPSKLFEGFINSGQTAMVRTPGILPLQGGVPIVYKGEVIGAVGVSGSSGETDHELATLVAVHLFPDETT